MTATIGGTLITLKLALSADQPNLSQTQIISYLLFGQPDVQSSDQTGLGNRSALLTSAVASLVSGQLEQSVVSGSWGIPIDYFEFDPGTSSSALSGAQLAAGWQIGRKTFLVLNAGYCPRPAPINLSNTLGASSPVPHQPGGGGPRRVSRAGAVLLRRDSSAPPGHRSASWVWDLFWERRY